MSQEQKGAAAVASPSPKIRARCKVEVFGSVRDPEARRGEIIELSREDFAKFGDAFEDVDAIERAAAEAAKPKVNEWFADQRVALQAEREASAKARAISAERQAEWARKVAEDARKAASGERRK